MTAERRQKIEAEAREHLEENIGPRPTSVSLSEPWGPTDEQVARLADLISRLVDEAVTERDREWRATGWQGVELPPSAVDAAVKRAVAEERKALRAYVARLLDVRPYRDSVLAALDAHEREKEK